MVGLVRRLRDFFACKGVAGISQEAQRWRTCNSQRSDWRESRLPNVYWCGRLPDLDASTKVDQCRRLTIGSSDRGVTSSVGQGGNR
jgi:hypothetical protein